MRSINIPRIPKQINKENLGTELIKIVNTSSKEKKESFCTRVDEGFIQKLIDEKNSLKNIIDLEIDPISTTLTIHFSKNN